MPHQLIQRLAIRCQSLLFAPQHQSLLSAIQRQSQQPETQYLLQKRCQKQLSFEIDQ